MRMTTKGQVTIPLPVRRGLGSNQAARSSSFFARVEAVLRAAAPETEPRERESRMSSPTFAASQERWTSGA